jgi:hypothetical protein
MHQVEDLDGYFLPGSLLTGSIDVAEATLPELGEDLIALLEDCAEKTQDSISSIMALARCRSSVSKPSVNQP